jgi:hypothetical protein
MPPRKNLKEITTSLSKIGRNFESKVAQKEFRKKKFNK